MYTYYTSHGIMDIYVNKYYHRAIILYKYYNMSHDTFAHAHRAAVAERITM